MYLWDGFKEREYIVERLDLDTKSKNLFLRMHIKKGCVIKIIRKHAFYPSLIEVDQMRIALDSKLLKRIWVIPYV